jgi:GTPase SAR1 family protein
MARIGFCGTTSCGKTTLVNALSVLPQFENYHIATERSKYLRDLGIPLNTDSTLKGQIIFLAERASELIYKNLITDRTVIDVIAFTSVAKSIDYFQGVDFNCLAKNLIEEYDYIFYVSPEGVEIEDNSVRTTDAQYRKLIDEVIQKILIENETYINNLIKIPPFLTTEQRVQFVLKSL